MNLKNKETQLFETLTKLDSIADLIKNSKEESSYLKKLSSQLEKEKEELHQKSKNLEQEKNMAQSIGMARPELVQVADTVARDKNIDREEVFIAM